MRLTLRFVLPLLAILSAIALAVSPLVENFTKRWFRRDLDMRGELVGNAIQDMVTHIMETQQVGKIVPYFTRVLKDERLMAIGFCDPQGNLLYRTQLFPQEINTAEILKTQEMGPRIILLPSGDVHVYVVAVPAESGPLGSLWLIHDMSYITRRSKDTQRYVFLFFVLLGSLISAITVATAHLSWWRWTRSVRNLISAGSLLKPEGGHTSSEFKPIMKDLRTLVRELEVNQKVRDESLISWTPRTLKEILHRELRGEEIITVSNREPYIHQRKPDGKVEVKFPASGLVTALEPVMRACSGTWIAHGSGNADRDPVDKQDRVRVPPDQPRYTLKRIWLTEEEEQGYYYGFSNEGLWPLCHIAHTRPVFRSSDWQRYVEVNQKFADAVLAEAKTDEPVVLVQDYHLALLPRMVRDQLPRATIITFWHIPWPNPEAISICPWREQILHGLLGSSIIGFHIQLHCNNFIDTVDRFLECRIDREHFNISYRRKITAINPYPISLEWPPRWIKGQGTIPDCRLQIRDQNGIPLDQKVGLGVDRLDYTKGIIERFLAIERLLELHPDWIGKFSFVQVAAPSRSTLETYRRFTEEATRQAVRINERFGQGKYRPIHFLQEHHNPFQVYEYYRGADFSMVSSLHDGMNLTAKEFIAARDDDLGVLILSLFTGASRELSEALIVNPYDTDQCAEAMHLALTMPPSEQRARMSIMRAYVKEYNIFRWAGRMLVDAAAIKRRRNLLGKIGNQVPQAKGDW